MSPDHVTPIKPNFKGEAEVGRKTRPDGAPRSDKNFNKLVKSPTERPDKEEEELAAEEVYDDRPSSVFDLSATMKSKKKSALSNASKQSAADLAAELVDADEKTPSLFAKRSALFDDGGIEMADNKEYSLTDMQIDDEHNDSATIEEFYADKAQSEFSPLTAEIKDRTIKDMPIKDQVVQGELVRETTNSQIKKGRVDIFSLAPEATLLAAKKDKAKLDAQSRNEFINENLDLSTINPNVAQQPVAFNSEKAHLSSENKMTRTNISDIVQQIVEKMETIRTEGRVDTVVTLRYPPLLEGATVTVSAFEGVKREFNIAFANLTDEAKRFLDRKIVEDSLKDTLMDKGLIINALTTTTLQEVNVNIDSNKFFTREEREQQRRQQQENPDEEA